MTSKRKNNWPAALALFVEEKQNQPFDWRTNNCGFFACDWIAILVGIDPAAEYRDKIDSALSAQRVLDAAGGVEAIATDAAMRWGWPPVPVSMARRGDVVSYEGDGGHSLGVCLGELSVFTHKEGLAFRPTLTGRKAWRIG
jgi:hypothetical protein